MATARKDDGILMPKLDLDNSRMIAAMKVTGIAEEDLYLKPPNSDTPQNDKQQLRYELLERKRRQLVHELDMLAEKLDDADVEAILSPRTQGDLAGLSVASQTVFEKERSKVDKQRARIRDEMQREVAKEMEKKQAFENTQRKQKEPDKRSPEQEKERQEELKKKQDEKEKQAQKGLEVAQKALREEREKRRLIASKIRESNERVARLMDEKTKERQQAMEDRRKKMGEIADRNMRHEQALDEEKLARHAQMLEKDRELERRRQQKQESTEQRAKERKANFESKSEVVREKLNTQASEREKAWMDTNEKLMQAKAHSKKQTEDIALNAKEKRDKESAKFETNRMQRRQERRQKLQKLKAELAESDTRSMEVKEKYFDETVGKKANYRDVFLDIVKKNQERIGRSDDSAREQTIAKIKMTNSKIDSMLEQRRQLIDYRTMASKDMMMNKTQLQELKNIMQDSSTKRINQILKEMGMPLLPAAPAKEGEEGDEKK